MTLLLKLSPSPLALFLIFILGLLETAFESFKNVKPLFIMMIFYVSAVDSDHGLSSGMGVELAPNKFFPFSLFLSAQRYFYIIKVLRLLCCVDGLILRTTKNL